MPRLSNTIIDTEENLVNTLTEIKNVLWPNKDTWDIVKADGKVALTPKGDLKGKVWLHAETTLPPGGGRRGNMSDNPDAVKRIRVSTDMDENVAKYWPESTLKVRHIYVDKEGIYDRVGIIDFISTSSQHMNIIISQMQRDEQLAVAENRFIKKLADRRANKADKNKQSILFKKALEAFGDKVESKYEPYYLNLRVKDVAVMKISVSDEKYSISEIVPVKEWNGDKLKDVVKFLSQLEGIL